MKLPRSLAAASAVAVFAAPPAGAGTVIADFNDLFPGAMRVVDGQPEGTGIGFASPGWENFTGIVLALEGDLAAPEVTGYDGTQSAGAGAGISLGNSFGGRIRRLQSRPTVSISGEVWLSALFSLNGTDAEGLIRFNASLTGGGAQSNGPAIGFGDNDASGAVGVVPPGNDAIGNPATADPAHRVDGAVLTDGAVNLLIAKIEMDAAGDTISLWVNPADATDEAALGVPTLSLTGPYFPGGLIDRVGYEAVREDDPAFDASGGLALLDNLKISDAPNAYDVVVKAVPPAVPAAELAVTAEPVFGDLVEMPATASGTLSVINNGGTDAVEITGITFGGDDAALFSTSAVFPVSVAANGGTADIAVDFDPAGAVGFFNATATIESDAPNSVPDVSLTAAFTRAGVDVLVNGDFESDGATVTDWLVSGGGSAAAPVAGIAPGSTTAAGLVGGGFIQQTGNLTPDWYAEFFFSAPDTLERAFNVLVSGPSGQINIRYQGDAAGQWNAFDNVLAADNWGGPLGLGSITPGATYLMRIVGRDFGGADPHYDLFLSDANGLALTSRVEGIRRFQNAVPTAARMRNLRFSTEFGNAPGFIVDDVALVTGPPPPDAPLAIVDVSYDADAGTATISWNAIVGVTYFVERSADLVAWDELDDSAADEALETFSDTGASGRLFFYRVLQAE